MRIAYVSETWLPCTDGIVTRLRATIGQLVEEGHQVLIVCPRYPDQGRDDDRADPRVTVRRVPGIGFRFIYGGQRWGLPVPAVRRHLRQFRPDVVHVVNPMLLGIAGVAATRSLRIPLAASYHTNVAAYADFYRLGVLRPVIWETIRLLHNRAGVNLVTSAASERDLAAHGVQRVRPWPRGVDLALFHPRTEAGGRRTDQPVALYVGRIAAEKGLHQLAPIGAPHSGFRLVMVGDGPHRAQLQALLGPQTRFTGTLHGLDLADAYRDADVFVFPSRTDTLGLVVLEALASGLPVVAVDSPATRDLLCDCPAARLVPADDPDALLHAVTELTGDPAGAAQHRRAARAFAERFGWQAATDCLVGYYRQLIDSRNIGGVRQGPGAADGGAQTS